VRKLLVTSSILALLAAPAIAGGMTRSWPKIDNWATIMLDGGPRGEMCSTIGASPSGKMLDIIMAGNTTHLYVSYGKADVALPPVVTLAAGGVPFFEAPILSKGMDAMGNRFVQADLPGSSYRDVVVPAMLRSSVVEVTLGDQRFMVPTKNFAQVVPQIIDCANAATQVGMH
jgi:hypothetical protein